MHIPGLVCLSQNTFDFDNYVSRDSEYVFKIAPDVILEDLESENKREVRPKAAVTINHISSQQPTNQRVHHAVTRGHNCRL